MGPHIEQVVDTTPKARYDKPKCGGEDACVEALFGDCSTSLPHHDKSQVITFSDQEGLSSSSISPTYNYEQASLENEELKSQLEESTSKHVGLQEKYDELLCSHENLIDSHAMLEAAHEVIIATEKGKITWIMDLWAWLNLLKITVGTWRRSLRRDQI
uniref:Uncharacterized protein n=2 Tax=Oryza sativa subsp. japonica TaxID=39947 RepID=Q53L35_ORYSJ|nr:hypothetical protein LOC_Os11g15110 [Oryza sativa Japonica Group]ABA92514.1 hypothetical protein LOC_Os11g15110 [Oryza sativa Japonica Group]